MKNDGEQEEMRSQYQKIDDGDCTLDISTRAGTIMNQSSSIYVEPDSYDSFELRVDDEDPFQDSFSSNSSSICKPKRLSQEELSLCSLFYEIKYPEKILKTIKCTVKYTFVADSLKRPSVKAFIGFTSYRILFYSDKFTNQTKLKMKFPLTFLAQCRSERRIPKIVIELLLKDLRLYRVILHDDQYGREFCDDLSAIIKPKSPDLMFPFSLDGTGPPKTEQFNIKTEMQRLGLFDEKNKKEEQFQQRPLLNLMNNDHSVCSSYPSTLITSYMNDDTSIYELATYFINNRFPIMTWMMNSIGASIWICSNFKGVSKRSEAKLIEDFLSPIKNNSKSKKLVIVCLASQNQNIQNQKLQNKVAIQDLKDLYNDGYTFYSYVPDFKRIRLCYFKLISISKIVGQSTEIKSSNIFSAIENSGWLGAISTIIKAAYDIACFVKVICLFFI